MLLQDVNPHIRFAQRIIYRSNRGMVYASDVHAFYVLSGSASFRIGETEYPAQKDTFFLIPPGVPYQILPSDSLSLIWQKISWGGSQLSIWMMVWSGR